MVRVGDVDTAVQQGRIAANGVDFAYLEAGVPGAPLALCLHGFPDSAWTWRFLLPALADAGFHAVAPWLRGYAPTSVPADARYQTGALVADADALHAAFDADGRAVVIGHDWGAMAAYGTANHRPEAWARVVAAAVPPAGAMGRGFLQYSQLRRSWYMFFFQNPLSDLAVAMNDLAFVDQLWSDWSPGYDATGDLRHVKDALRDPANLAAALGYYRALLGGGAGDPALADEQAATGGAVAQPTLYLHGDRDGCVGVELAAGSEAFLGSGSRVVTVKDAGHFLHVEKPDEVNAEIISFVTAG